MAYIYKFKLQMQVYLTYRFEVFASILIRFILIMANLFLWSSVYSNQNNIAGVEKEQMFTYSLLSVCISVMYQCGIQSSLNNAVREGNISVLLMRPFNLLGAYLAEDLGTIVVKTVTISIPLWILGNLFLPVQMPESIKVFPIIFISYLLGLLILWLLSALVGMFTFVTMELGDMGVVKDTVVAILSGSMIPLWFFPEHAEEILMLTPFPYTYQTTLGLYIGKIGIAEGLNQMNIQTFWVIILWVLVLLVWKKVQNNVLIQGG